jgi:ribosomal RNA-processing protein 17
MNKTNNARKKNKSNKTSVVFNEASRKDFLTGFRKRKNERRKKAKDQLEKEYKEEVRRAKQKAREDVIHSKATGASHQILPEIEHLIQGDYVSNSTTEDYGTHTVSVTHLNGFGKTSSDIGETNDAEHDNDLGNNIVQETNKLAKHDLKNINKLVAKKVSKSKVFAHIKQQSTQKEGQSASAKKANKLKTKFSKKRAESKRSKHYNPKNKSHKKNKAKS